MSLSKISGIRKLAWRYRWFETNFDLRYRELALANLTGRGRSNVVKLVSDPFVFYAIKYV